MHTQVGAFSRDPMDTRLLLPVRLNRIAQSRTDHPGNDALLPAYQGTPPRPPADTDGDGMPDFWEISRELDPHRANHNGYVFSSIHTNLEVYLHELSVRLQAE